MNLSAERAMVLQAVIDGQIGSEHVTIDELVRAHHFMADVTIQQNLLAQLQRDDVTAFELPWQYLAPN